MKKKWETLMKRILIADREESGRLYADELVKEGYHVRCLSDGFVAVREIVANPPDLVIVDGILPGISGTWLVMMIKSSHPGVPGCDDLIIITRSVPLMPGRMPSTITRAGGFATISLTATNPSERHLT